MNRVLAADKLAGRLQDSSDHAGVVGLGYTGLPQAVEAARAGFRVTGVDTDHTRVAATTTVDAMSRMSTPAHCESSCRRSRCA